MDRQDPGVCAIQDSFRRGGLSTVQDMTDLGSRRAALKRLILKIKRELLEHARLKMLLVSSADRVIRSRNELRLARRRLAGASPLDLSHGQRRAGRLRSGTLRSKRVT